LHGQGRPLESSICVWPTSNAAVNNVSEWPTANPP
jgi:hypothetical protein